MASYSEIKAWRVKIMHETMEIARNGYYTSQSGNQVDLPLNEMKNGVYRCCMIHDATTLPFTIADSDQGLAKISVIDQDCLDAAIDVKNQGHNPVVLNMASWTHPGGGYLSGAGAQEESLFRRTNYFQHLVNPDHLPQEKPFHYPIPEFGAIYSPDAVIFRASEKDRYRLLEAPIEMAFIAIPAYHDPPIVDGRLTDDYARRTRKKIDGILTTAAHFHHDAIVLSAFGCGAFKNPPQHMAELFKEAIQARYLPVFKQIVFAIFDDHNAGKFHNPRGNFLPFRDTFAECVASGDDIA